VKPAPFEYHRPPSLADAVALKARLGSSSAVLAGGQSLVPMMSMRMAQPEALIDLGAVTDLAGVERSDGHLRVGAMTRTRDLERSSAVFEVCPLLRQAIVHVAHPAIRNRGTVGGSIAHADPAAELPAVLALLGGSVVVRGPEGAREIVAERFFEGHFTTSMRSDEILTEIRFPVLSRGTGTAFAEIARRHGDFAMAGAGAVAWPDRVRIVMFGVDARPIVVETADPAVAVEHIDPTDDVHGSAAYRRKLVRSLLRSVIRSAQDQVTS